MTLIFATSNANKVREIASLLPESMSVQSLADIGWTEELPETRDTIEGNSLQKAEYLAQRTGLTCFAEDTGLIIDALDGRPGVYSARYAGPDAAYQDNVNKVLAEMEGMTDRRARFKTVITYYVPAITPKSPEGDLNTNPESEFNHNNDAAVEAPFRAFGGNGAEDSTPKSPEGDLNTNPESEFNHNNDAAVEAPFRGFGGNGAEDSTPKSPEGDLNTNPESEFNQNNDAAVEAPFRGFGGKDTYYPEGKHVQFTGLCEGTILTAPRGDEGFGYDPIFVPEGCNLSFAEMRLNEKNVFSHRKKALEQFLQYLKNL